MTNVGNLLRPETDFSAYDVALSAATIYAAYGIGRLRFWRHEATHDQLTDALNQRGLDRALGRLALPVAVIYIDGTGQKAINDKYGHDEGNKAIRGTADVARSALRDGDLLARIGGDEFLGILLPKRRSIRQYIRSIFKSTPHERRTQDTDPHKILGGVINRFRTATADYRAANSKFAKLGFTIAIGGAVLNPGMKLEEFKAAAKTAESEMYVDKDHQHDEFGKYR